MLDLLRGDTERWLSFALFSFLVNFYKCIEGAITTTKMAGMPGTSIVFPESLGVHGVSWRQTSALDSRSPVTSIWFLKSRAVLPTTHPPTFPLLLAHFVSELLC